MLSMKFEERKNEWKEIEPRAGALISRELEIQDESIYCDESVFVDGVDFWVMGLSDGWGLGLFISWCFSNPSISGEV